MRIDLRHLHHLIVLAETSNFASAAASLGLSQPALSRSIQTLEQRVGARLLDRGRRGIVPTPVGERLIEHARGLLSHAAEAERDVGLLIGNEAGHLRIGAGPYPATLSVGSTVARLIQRHPRLSIEVQVGDWSALTGMVLERRIDLAIAELPSNASDDRLAVEPLPKHAGGYYCRANHPLARRRSLTLQDLRRFPLAMTSLPERLHHVASAVDGAERARVARPSIHVNTFDLARRIVLESDALGLATPQQVAEDIAIGKVVMLNVATSGAHTNYGVIRLAGRTLSPAAVAFIEILRDVEREIATLRNDALSRRPSRRPRRGA